MTDISQATGSRPQGVTFLSQTPSCLFCVGGHFHCPHGPWCPRSCRTSLMHVLWELVSLSCGHPSQGGTASGPEFSVLSSPSSGHASQSLSAPLPVFVLSHILLPGCPARPLGGTAEERERVTSTHPAPFLPSCQTPDKVFSSSISTLNGPILSGRLGSAEPPPPRLLWILTPAPPHPPPPLATGPAHPTAHRDAAWWPVWVSSRIWDVGLGAGSEGRKRAGSWRQCGDRWRSHLDFL